MVRGVKVRWGRFTGWVGGEVGLNLDRAGYYLVEAHDARLSYSFPF